VKDLASRLAAREDRRMTEFTSYAHGTPCWVDVTSGDLAGTITFYTSLFGWKAEQVPQPDAGGYTMFTLNDKYVAAGSPPQQEGTPSYWTTYIASDDVDDTAAKIRDAGGTVMMDPFDVYDSGRMTIAQDPTGATFGVWQAKEHIGAQLANEPGTLTWNQCETNDPARAAEFYQAVFGYGISEMDMGGEQPFRVLEVDGKRVGGVREPTSGDAPPHWSTVFSVADTDATVSRAKELGGTVLMEPLDLPDIGRIAVLQDQAGAVFQVIASAPPPS
jgi:predicted enzyme related to lactoylglutathione lyase